MVVGGYNNPARNDVELVDLSGRLRQCSKPVNYPYDVDDGSIGTFFDGRPLVCGGFDRDTQVYSDSCHRYDFQSNNWLSGPPDLNVVRWEAAGSFLTWDQWWVSGGSDGSDLDADTTSEVISAGKSTFELTGFHLPESLQRHSMVRVNDTAVVFVGSDAQSNNRAYLFDANTQRFQSLPTLSIGRAAPFAGTVCISAS